MPVVCSPNQGNRFFIRVTEPVIHFDTAFQKAKSKFELWFQNINSASDLFWLSFDAKLNLCLELWVIKNSWLKWHNDLSSRIASKSLWIAEEIVKWLNHSHLLPYLHYPSFSYWFPCFARGSYERNSVYPSVRVYHFLRICSLLCFWFSYLSLGFNNHMKV